MNRAALLAVSCALAGCAAPVKAWRAAPLTALKAPPASEYPDSPAVYLFRERRYFMRPGWRGKVHIEAMAREDVHDAVAILNERGYKYANVRIPFPKGATISEFYARTIAPD